MRTMMVRRLEGPAALVVKDPYYSFRLREYPAFGPDHYEALPDDLADDDETVMTEEQSAESAEAALSPEESAPAPSAQPAEAVEETRSDA